MLYACIVLLSHQLHFAIHVIISLTTFSTRMRIFCGQKLSHYSLHFYPRHCLVTSYIFGRVLDLGLQAFWEAPTDSVLSQKMQWSSWTSYKISLENWLGHTRVREIHDLRMSDSVSTGLTISKMIQATFSNKIQWQEKA